MRMRHKDRVGLVLSGGGARGAYQAGVLKAITEIVCAKRPGQPFPMVSGVSAGAINAAFWASYAHDPLQAAARLTNLWQTLTADQVFRTDVPSLSRIGVRWLTDLAFGGVHKHVRTQALLDTRPLHQLLEKVISFSAIQKNVLEGHLDAIGITALDYASSDSITFVQARESMKMWSRSRRYSERAILNVQHVMGSAAIPLFFPPVPLEERYLGDGSLRNLAPLSPAIHLGADKLIVVSIRKQQPSNTPVETAKFRPSIARVLSVLLNAVFMDATELDIERLSRINSTVAMLHEHPEIIKTDFQLRPVEFLWIQPSQDIGMLAQSYSDRLPGIIQYLLRGLGSIEEASEIVSYLLFEPSFCSRLVVMGYQDCMDRKQQIETFFNL